LQGKKGILVRHGHVIEETLRGGRSVGKKTPILALASFTETVSAGVPEDFPTLGVAKRHIGHSTITLQWATEIPKPFSLNLGNDNVST
jgi:hypothetical protein